MCRTGPQRSCLVGQLVLPPTLNAHGERPPRGRSSAMLGSGSDRRRPVDSTGIGKKLRVVLVGLYGDRSFGTAAGSKVSRANPVVAIVYGAGVGHGGGPG